MPSRSARRQTTLAGLFTMLGLVATAPSFAQKLSLPSDPLAGTVIVESTATPVESAAASPLTSAPMSPDAGIIGQGPISASAAGGYYNPLLGSHIRARYNTQSYGQQAGTLDLGTMKLMPLEGGMAFVDGQVTLNDESHVGYNLGVGYRWMTLPLFPFSPDDRKIMGVSVWSDGGSKGGSNFFPQIGTSLEFLGDRIDFRANGYAPVGDRTQTRDFTPTTAEGFTGNGIGLLLQGVEDTALTVGEAELAGRLGDLDAWAFAGVYGMRGGIYDAVGGKVGLRGYVTPDLFLSVGVANDDEFDTNALVNLTWFIGRTRAENCPTGILEDRLREPVLRNNYVASQERVVTRVGDAARAADGSALRIVHVDSTAAPGGDGTFENPFNSLDDITDTSTLANDTILFHGGSDFNNQQAMLLDGQIALGEGNNFVTTIETFELGTTNLPETAPGAQAGPRPTIDGGAGAGIVLADGNTVENIDFDGGLNAITNNPAGSNGTTLRNLSIANTTGDGISLAAVVGTDADDIDNDGDTTDDINLLGAISISDIDFDGVGGHDIEIDADAGTLADADILNESIAISNVTSNNSSASQSIAIRNTTAGGTAAVSNLTYDGGVTGAGGLLIDQTAGGVTITGAELTGGSGTAATFTQTTGTINASGITYDGEATAAGGLLVDRTEANVSVTNSTLTAGNGPGVRVSQTTGPVSIGSTVDITDIGGKSVVIENPTGGTPTGVAIGATISNTTVDGGGITIDDNEAIVSVTGNITTQNDQSVVINNSRANITVSGDIDDNGTGDAITINNAGVGAAGTAEVAFSGDLNNEEGRSLAISGGDDNIFIATNAAGSNSGSYVDNGDGILIENRGAGSEVTFGTPTSQVTINSETSNGVTLDNNDATSIVTFLADLDITTTSGTGIVSDEGQLDASNAGNTITTDGGQALNITGGASTTGIRFENVTTGADLASRPVTAVSLQDFDGTVTINDGFLRASGTPAVDVRNTELVMDGVDIDSNNATDVAVNAVFNDDTDRALTISNADLNGGNVTVTSPSGSGVTTTTISDATNVGLVTYNLNSTSDDVINLTDVTNDADFDFTIGNAGTGSLDVNMTDITSTGGVTFQSEGSGISTLDIVATGTNTNTFAGALDLSTNGAGSLNATVQDSTGFAETIFSGSGLGNSSLALTDVTTTGGFAYEVIDDGNLTLTMTNVTGTGATTLNVTDDGNGLLTMNNVNTGSTIAAASTAVADGNLTLNVTNSGNTTAFTGLTFNDLGDGNGSASFSNVTSNSGVEFDSAGDGTAQLLVNGGSYGDQIRATATNNDDFTADVIGNPDVATNGVAISAQNTGTFDTTVTGVTDGAGGSAGDLTITSANSVTNATVDVNNGSYGAVTITNNNTGTLNVTTDGVDATGELDVTTGSTVTNSIVSVDGGTVGSVDLNHDNTGTLATNVSGVTTAGVVDIDVGNTVTTASIDMTNGSNDGVVINADNAEAVTSSLINVTSTGSLDFTTTNAAGGTDLTLTGGSYDGGIAVDADTVGIIEFAMTGVTVDTQANTTAVDLDFGSSITSGNIDIMNNDAIDTLDALAMDLAITGGATGINLRLANNEFTNNSATDQTVFVAASGTAVVNTTISNNEFTNANAVPAVEFEIASLAAGSPTINLNLIDNDAASSGGGFGSGDILVRKSGGTFRVFELDNTFDNVNDRNNATITFDPNDRTQFDDLAIPPAQP